MEVLYKRFVIPVVIGMLIFSPIFIHVFFPKKDSGKALALTIKPVTEKEVIEEKPVDIDPMKDIIKNMETIEKEGVHRTVTMYTSAPEQTDSSPCISARGHNICELWDRGYNLCASNAFAIGTILRIDKLEECIVLDRMASKYPNRIDWYAGYDVDCLDGYDKDDHCPNRDSATKQILFVTPIGHTNEI